MRRAEIMAAFAGWAVMVPADVSAATVEQRIEVAPGVALRTVESGRATAPLTVVMIPGWSAGADIWSNQADRLSAAYRVIAFDPRSQGDSTKTTSGNTPEQRAADLHALLAAKHGARPVLVGWSQAVQDIAAYVTRYGTRDIAGIVLVDAAVSDGAKGIEARPKDAAAQFGRFAIYQSAQEDYLRGMFGFIISKPQPAEIVEQAVATGMKTPPSIGIAMLVADMFGIDRTPALAKIDCPLLIIAAGSSGELAQQQAEAALVRNARFVRIDDAGHAVFLDQPERFGTTLSTFLKELGTSTGR